VASWPIIAEQTGQATISVLENGRQTLESSAEFA
jgi:hypothetical protein